MNELKVREMVKLRYPDGSFSDWIDRESAAIIRAFSFINQPEIVENSKSKAELSAAIDAASKETK